MLNLLFESLGTSGQLGRFTTKVRLVGSNCEEIPPIHNYLPVLSADFKVRSFFGS